MHIVLISGTNRAGSTTLKVTQRLEQRYKAAGVETTLLDLQELPAEVLTPGAYDERPDGWAPFAEAVLAADGLVVVTPEYNGSFPGALKLFIDMLPFPKAFDHRPVAFVGLSSGRWGGLRPVEHLQGVFGYRNAFVFPERVFLPSVGDALDPETLDPTHPFTAQLLTEQISGFIAFCRAVAPMAANARHA